MEDFNPQSKLILSAHFNQLKKGIPKMPKPKISEVDPYDRKVIPVLDSTMSYIDVGEGDAIVFIHGNGTFSYAWRNIIPYLESQGRCLAMYLMGCGKSGDIPSGSYLIPEQSRYLEAWFEATDLGDNIHLVLHDWGGPLGFDWAYRNQDRVKSITYMETLVTARVLPDLAQPTGENGDRHPLPSGRFSPPDWPRCSRIYWISRLNR